MYYAAYHRALEWGRAQTVGPWTNQKAEKDKPKISDHLYLWTYLANRTGFQEFLGWGYDQCHSDRCASDYDLYVDFTDGAFLEQWNNINKLHHLLDGLPEQWPTDPDTQKMILDDLADRFLS